MLGLVYYGVVILRILIMIGLKWAGVNKGWRAPATRSLARGRGGGTGQISGGLEHLSENPLAKYLQVRNKYQRRCKWKRNYNQGKALAQ